MREVLRTLPIAALFHVSSAVFAFLGLVAFMLPLTFGCLFYSGHVHQWGKEENGGNGIQSSAGHVILRCYGAVLMGHALIQQWLSKQHCPEARRYCCWGYAATFVFSTAEIVRAHSSNRGDMTLGVEGVIFALTFAGLALMYVLVSFSPEMDAEHDDGNNDAGEDFGLQMVFMVNCALCALGGVLGLAWPRGFGVFFYDGDTETGLQHEAAHVLVRLFASLLLAQAWIAWRVGSQCGRQDLRSTLVNAFGASSGGIALVLVECHQRRDGTMTSFAGGLMLAVACVVTLSFGFFWYQFRSAEISRPSSRGLYVPTEKGERESLCKSASKYGGDMSETVGDKDIGNKDQYNGTFNVL